MAWVKSEYAGEFAVLSTWIAVALPWTVSRTKDGPLQSVLFFFRFGIFEVQLRFPSKITFNGVPLEVERALAVVYSGTEVGGNFYLDVPPLAATFYDGTMALAYVAYTLGAVLLAGAFVLSLAVYLRESRVRSMLPMRYPRLTGYVLAAVTLFFTVSTVALAQGSVPMGLPIPVGLVVLAFLAAVLIRADLVDEPDAA